MSTFNRAARRSGGDHAYRFNTGEADGELLLQEAIIRANYGEEGVEAFWRELAKKADAALQASTQEKP